MEQMKELNRFLEKKAEEGLSAETLKGYFWQVLDFTKHYDEMTEESLTAYIEAAEKRGVGKKSLRIYEQTIKQFIDFVNGASPKEERQKNKKDGKRHPLLGIVLAESYVDSEGILRVKGSHVPALFSWCTAARGNIDFNYAATRKLRKEHNRKMNPKIHRKNMI